MPKTKISEFSATPGNNTDIDGINIAEGCAPSGINDAIRELMSQLKDFQAGTAGDSFNGPVGTTTAAAGAFTTLTTSSTVTHNGGTANGVAYLNGSKVLTTGSALTFDSSERLIVGGSSAVFGSRIEAVATGAGDGIAIRGRSADNLGRLSFIQNAAATSLADIRAETGLLAFSLASSEQMRLTSTGLGIGTSSPNARLTTISSASGVGAQINTSLASAGSTAIQLGGYLVGFESSTGVTLRAIHNHGATNASSLAFEVNGTTEAMRIDSSGNLGLGVTPSAWGASAKALEFSGGSVVGFGTGSLEYWYNAYNNGTNTVYKFSGTGAMQYKQTGNGHTWFTAPSGTAGNAISFTQAMTLDASGNLLLGTTSQIDSGSICLQKSGAASNGIVIKDTNAGGGNQLKFLNSSGTTVGYINQNGTVTVYSTTSDQRLKENIQDADSASALIDAIQVRKYDWKADGSHQRYGFVAQELVTVAPEAVYQPKDPEEMMAVDYSKLVPMLVKEIQSLRKRLAAAGIA